MKKFRKLVLFLFLLPLVSCGDCSLNIFMDDDSEDSEPVMEEPSWHGILTLDSFEDSSSPSTPIIINEKITGIAYYRSTDNDLCFLRSDSWGTEWGTPIAVDTEGTTGYRPSMASEGDNIYISYYQLDDGDLKFARSRDTGISWLSSDIKTITSEGMVGSHSSICIAGEWLCVAYSDYVDNDYYKCNLKFIRSSDRGDSWPAENITTIDSSPGTGVFLSIKSMDSKIYAFYYDTVYYKIKFARSDDYGATWPAENISAPLNDGLFHGKMSFAVTSTVLYLAYRDETNSDLRFARSDDCGATWPVEKLRQVDSDGDVGTVMSIAVNGSCVYIAYYDFTNKDLKFARSDDGGDTWPSENIHIVDSEGDVGYSPSIQASGTSVYISYQDQTNNAIKFAKSIDNGDSW